MEKNNITIDNEYAATSKHLKKPFIGIVKIKLSRDVIMIITNYDAADYDNVKELEGIIGIKCEDVCDKHSLIALQQFDLRIDEIKQAELEIKVNEISQIIKNPSIVITP